MGETKKWNTTMTQMAKTSHMTHTTLPTRHHPATRQKWHQKTRKQTYQYQNSATPHKDRHQHHKNDNEDTHQRQQNPTKPITTHRPMEPNPSMTQTSRGDADTPPNPEKPKINRTRAGNLTNDNKKWHIKKQIDQWKKKKKKWKKRGTMYTNY